MDNVDGWSGLDVTSQQSSDSISSTGVAEAVPDSGTPASGCRCHVRSTNVAASTRLRTSSSVVIRT